MNGLPALRRLVWWLIRLGSAAVLLLLAMGYLQGYRLLAVQSNSMQPVFARGDALVVRRTTADTLLPGMIISYRSPVNGHVTISHRLLRLDEGQGTLITQGDALSEPDPAVPDENLIGQDRAVIPSFGRLLDALHTPLGLAAAVYLPAAAFGGRAVWRFSRQSYHPVYRVYP